jgi:hypothetical protein
LLFSAFTGQRSQATTARLTVEQFRTAVDQNKPVINVLPEQDKIRMQHYCPLHPQVVDALSPLPGSQQDSEPIFKQLSFERWLKHQNIQLLNSNAHFVPGDPRKFCEQHGDTLQWDQSNKNYILSTGFLGSIDDFISTDCLKTCMIYTLSIGKMCVVFYESSSSSAKRARSLL